MAQVGRIAGGIAVGAGALAAGGLALNLRAQHTKRATLENGHTSWLDNTGIPAALPGVLGAGLVVASVGAAVMSARSGSIGQAARLAAGSIGAAAAGGALIGFHVGEFQGTDDPGYPAAESRFEAQRQARWDAERTSRQQASDQVEQQQLESNWGSPDRASGVSIESAANHGELTSYDHNHDGTIDLRPGQPMVADERVIHDRGFLGSGDAEVTDGDQRIATQINVLSAFDTNGDQRIQHDELVAGIAKRFDTDGDGVLTTKDAFQLPDAKHFGDYHDFG
jgi:hypothetical protein